MTRERDQHRLRPKIEIALKREKQTEVVDNLEGGIAFTEKIINEIAKNENGLTIIWVFGETGSGKETVAGQITERIKESPQIQAFEERIGKKVGQHYLSLGASLKELTRRKIVTSPWGEFTPQEFSTNSDFIAHAIAWARDKLPRPTVLKVEVVGIAFPFNLGFSAFAETVKDSKDKQRKNINNFAIFLISDPHVQDRAYRVRNSLWSPESPKNADELFREERTILDISVAGKEEELKYTMGNAVARARTTSAINNYLAQLVKEKKLPFSHITLEDLQKFPSLRSEVLRRALRQLVFSLGTTIGMQADRCLVSANIFLEDLDIHVFRGEVEKSMLPVKRIPYPYSEAPQKIDLKEIIL